MATSVSDETLFIFKHSQDVIDSLREVKEISFELECLKRPEFPTIIMFFRLVGDTNNPYQFEYSFAIESDQELDLLKKLSEQDRFYIYFFDKRVRYSKTVFLNNIDRERIKSMIVEATN